MPQASIDPVIMAAATTMRLQTIVSREIAPNEAAVVTIGSLQAGTKEIFLSNAVRQFQALDQAGIPVKLDLYEGMWHIFQVFNHDLPESKLARKKVRGFLEERLGK